MEAAIIEIIEKLRILLMILAAFLTLILKITLPTDFCINRLIVEKLSDLPHAIYVFYFLFSYIALFPIYVYFEKRRKPIKANNAELKKLVEKANPKDNKGKKNGKKKH